MTADATREAGLAQDRLLYVRRVVRRASPWSRWEELSTLVDAMDRLVADREAAAYQRGFEACREAAVIERCAEVAEKTAKDCTSVVGGSLPWAEHASHSSADDACHESLSIAAAIRALVPKEGA